MRGSGSGDISISLAIARRVAVKKRRSHIGPIYSFDVASFLFYDCAVERECATCVRESRPECSWCLSSLTCSSAAVCDFPSPPGQCPTLTGLVISSISSFTSDGGESVSATGTLLFPIPGLMCRVSESSEDTNATVIGDTVSCLTPPTRAGPQTLTLVLGSTVYTTSTVTLSFYDCAQQLRCSDCYDAVSRPGCRWCLDQQSCTGQAACAFPATEEKCPRLHGYRDSSVQV
jgi:plexin-like protein